MIKTVKLFFFTVLITFLSILLLTSCEITEDGDFTESENSIPSASNNSGISTNSNIIKEDNTVEDYSDGVDHWGKLATLEDHFIRHGEEVGATSKEHYAQLAYDFFVNQEDYKVKIDEDGLFRIYDEDNNLFAAYNKDGTTRTFFYPSGGSSYFFRQPGELIYGD